MKTIKFKNVEVKKRNKIIITLVISCFLVLFFSHRIGLAISSRMSSYLVQKVQKQNLLFLKEAFSYLLKDEVEMDTLLMVIKNSKDEIVEINFDIKASTVLLSNITGYINNNIEGLNYHGYRLDVPLGMISRNPLFMNLGPTLPVKIELSDVALGNVKTKVREFGINSALIEVYLEVTINTSIIYPFEILEEPATYEALVSTKVIQGIVPSFYNGVINSKSDTINLPMTE